MGPHPQDLHHALLREHLIHETVLDVNSSGVGSGQIADGFFEGGGFWNGSSNRISKMISAFGLSPARASYPGDLLRLLGEDEKVFHQSSFFGICLNGCGESGADGFPHPGNRDQIQALLDSPPILLGNQNRIGAFSRYLYLVEGVRGIFFSKQHSVSIAGTRHFLLQEFITKVTRHQKKPRNLASLQ